MQNLYFFYEFVLLHTVQLGNDKAGGLGGLGQAKIFPHSATSARFIFLDFIFFHVN